MNNSATLLALAVDSFGNVFDVSSLSCDIPCGLLGNLIFLYDIQRFLFALGSLMLFSPLLATDAGPQPAVPVLVDVHVQMTVPSKRNTYERKSLHRGHGYG